jgi:DNA segregation ATPase FtsK/SpoIIIE, S-DNA-T family
MLSPVRSDRTVLVRPERIHLHLWGVLAVLGRIRRLLQLIFRSPSALICLCVGAAGWIAWHYLPPAIPLVMLASIISGQGLWMWCWPDSYEKQVHLRLRSYWREHWVYRRRWSAVMETAGLLAVRNGRRYAPDLRKVTSTRNVDTVRIRLLPGQHIADFEDRSERLAVSFGGYNCRVHTIPGSVREIQLWMLADDPLAEMVAPFNVDPGDPLPAAGMPVGLREDGEIWRLRLVNEYRQATYGHILFVGATRSGKSSAVWALLRCCMPAIRYGLIKVWCIDPKGGVEFAMAGQLFDRVAFGDADDPLAYESDYAELLEDAVLEMRRRQARLRGHVRAHGATVDEPLMLIVVDEIASLTEWMTDRPTKQRISSALALLQSQGAGAGVIVIGAAQDARKEILQYRGLFTVRNLFRVAEAQDVTTVLGPGARDRGALADRIPDTLRGVSYVQVEGIAEPVRVRYSWISDAEIDRMAAAMATPAPVVQLRPGKAA